ncbi:Uncharacterised protein [Streptococcus pneumoniae]|nr:Uncharacterised protein [Streptococcus pneumoniae]CAG6221539.1 Uncharacterised protein [Streptococcus pneumoniae]CAG6342525.1 Uncharacterised protein [Streptococcus pneumoniae]
MSSMKTDKADLVKLIFVLMKGRQEHTIPANGNDNIRIGIIEYKLISLQTISQFIQNPLTLRFSIGYQINSFTCILHLYRHCFLHRHLIFYSKDQKVPELLGYHHEFHPFLHPTDGRF